MGTAAKVAVFAVPIAIIIVIAGIVVPMLTSRSETEYFGSSELKAAVNIESLSTVDYGYTGIAEKAGKWLWMDNVAYRVKYEAHVTATCNMGEIEFVVDQENKTVTAYLPEATIEEPVLVTDSFDYLPSDPGANISDVIKLCKEDAANDVDKNQIQQEAYESLESTVRALTTPILGDDGWKLKFDKLANYQGDDGAEAETEAATAETAGTEANNEA